MEPQFQQTSQPNHHLLPPKLTTHTSTPQPISQSYLQSSNFTKQKSLIDINTPEQLDEQQYTRQVCIKISNELSKFDGQRMYKFIKDIHHVYKMLHWVLLGEGSGQDNKESLMLIIVKQYKMILDEQLKELAEVAVSFFVQAYSKMGRVQVKISEVKDKLKYEEFIRYAMDLTIQYGLYKIFVEPQITSTQFFRYFLVSSQQCIKDALNQAIQEILHQQSDDTIRNKIQDLKQRKKSNSPPQNFSHNIDEAILYNYTRLTKKTEKDQQKINKLMRQINKLKKQEKVQILYPEKLNIMYYCKCVVMASLGQIFDVADVFNQYLTVKRPFLYDLEEVKSVKERILMRSYGQDDVVGLIQPTHENFQKLGMILLDKLKQSGRQDIQYDLIEQFIQNKVNPNLKSPQPLQISEQLEQAPNPEPTLQLPSQPQPPNFSQYPEKEVQISSKLKDHLPIRQMRFTYIKQIKRKVLQIDGGGMKGLVALFILAQIQFRTNVKVYQIFDLFVGTSIGGLICLAFAMKKYSAQELLCKILGLVKNRIFAGWLFSNFFRYGVGYPQAQIQKFLKQLCLAPNNHQYSLQHPQKTLDFIITTCTYSRYPNQTQITPHIFYKYTNAYNQVSKGLLQIKIRQNNNIEFEQRQQIFENVEYWKILRATSAAFPYFKPVVIHDQEFFDGGFMFNTPSFIACRFLESNGVKLGSVYMLSIGLEKLERNQQVFDGFEANFNKINQIIRDKSIIKVGWNKNYIGSSMTNVSNYCNQKALQLLGNNIIRYQPIQKLDVSLNNTDYTSIQKMLRIAQKTIITLDLNSTIIQFGLQDHQEEEGMNIRRHYPRSILYKQSKSYQQLDQIFQQNYHLDDRLDQIKQIFQHFQFPQEADKTQKRKNNPFMQGRSLKHQLLAQALSVGHYKSIMYFKQGNGLEELKTFWQWNCYHIAIANDEVLSLHILNYDYLTNIPQVCLPNSHSSNFLHLTLSNTLQNQYTYNALQHIKQKICLQKCNYSMFLKWKNKTARQFIFDYGSEDTKRYMNKFVGYMKQKNFDFNWVIDQQTTWKFYELLNIDVVLNCLFLIV